jgi:hypothetical protein
MEGKLVMPRVITLDEALQPPKVAAEPQRPMDPKRKRGRPKGSRNRARGVSRVSEHTEQDVSAVRIDARAISRDLAAAAAQAATHARPSTDDWVRLLRKASVYASVGLAAYLSRPGPYNKDFELSLVDATDIVSPPSRLIAASKFNQRWGHRVMEAGEYLDAIRATAMYGSRITPGIKAKVMRQSPPPANRRYVDVNDQREIARTGTPTRRVGSDDGDVVNNGTNERPIKIVASADTPEPPPRGSWEPQDHTSQRSD